MAAEVLGAIAQLMQEFTRLPGIGSRTAQRLAFHLLQVPKTEANALAHAIQEVKVGGQVVMVIEGTLRF